MSTLTQAPQAQDPTSHPLLNSIVRQDRLVALLQKAGMHITRYSLVVVFLWIGGMKFTNYEAEGIRPFVKNTPLMSWLYQIFSVSQFSATLGVAEILNRVYEVASPDDGVRILVERLWRHHATHQQFCDAAFF